MRTKYTHACANKAYDQHEGQYSRFTTCGWICGFRHMGSMIIWVRWTSECCTPTHQKWWIEGGNDKGSKQRQGCKLLHTNGSQTRYRKGPESRIDQPTRLLLGPESIRVLHVAEPQELCLDTRRGHLVRPSLHPLYGRPCACPHGFLLVFRSPSHSSNFRNSTNYERLWNSTILWLETTM
jgi:hypothetical protein